jgi:hypothetical protein
MEGQFDQDRIVTETLTSAFGGGAVGASGWVTLTGFALQDFSLRTHFSGVTVRFPEGLTSTLSGELSYDGDAKEQALTGDVLIQRRDTRSGWTGRACSSTWSGAFRRSARRRWAGWATRR